MQNTSTIILSRMLTASRDVDVIANNIANASTPGYQSLHLASTSWLDHMRGVTAPPGGSTQAYTQSNGTWRDAQPGTIRNTGNPLDLALPAGGYFTVQTPNGPRLTRDGQFNLMPDGTIANADGYSLLSTNAQPITVPPQSGALTIAADGTVSTQQGIIGQIGVVTVANPQTLTAQGANLFQAAAPPIPSPNPQIVQGAVEESNVQPVTEITNMIQASRNYEMLAQFLTSEKSRSQSAISQILGGTTS
ncbi:MAG TPA: flagellar basal-body rod protein FlgF [Acidiphilium sp.]|jgi:flagellar basal-body rod protein FlgF|uniref:flagellar basal-body rod protein FlgF n=1 Tax=Acidiphilium sp. C61 TaxID=1671485 RepID=UPI00157B685F|nr:flagellar basal-body rod protein FlgF [Acidiphilium sp. C61]HQT73898.1 flagellar basal-body rod protein FlgF [Acidiphilium sp.]